MSTKYDNRPFDLNEDLALHEVTAEVHKGAPAATAPPRMVRPTAESEARRATAIEATTAPKPAVDIAENGEVVLFMVDLPGIEEKDVDVHIGSDLLTIRARYGAPDESITAWHLRERSRQVLERVILIPEGIDVDDASMQVRNGVLTVRMAKTAKPRKGVVLAS
jgi:HSP20 family protein